MKLLKLTALFPLLAVTLFFASCETDAEMKKATDYQKTGIVMSSAQEPQGLANPSSALGSINVFYSKKTKLLQYTVTWSGLTGPVNAMHIHGRAPVGFNAGVVQNIVIPGTSTSTTIFAGTLTNGQPRFLANGTLSATLLVDEIVVKENDLLNGMYYINIHTGVAGFAPGNPSGEIRGQIVFQ